MRKNFFLPLLGLFFISLTVLSLFSLFKDSDLEPGEKGEVLQQKDTRENGEPIEIVSASSLKASVSMLPIASSSAQVVTSTPDEVISTETISSGGYDFNVTVKDSSQGSDLVLTIEQTGGEALGGIRVDIPTGWDIPASVDLAQGEKVGDGIIRALLNGQNVTLPVTIINEQDSQGHHNYWKVIFGDVSSPFVILDSFVDGDSENGYSWIVDRKFLFDIKPPIGLDLTLYANNIGARQIKAGDTFSIIYKFRDGTSRVIQKIIQSFN